MRLFICNFLVIRYNIIGEYNMKKKVIICLLASICIFLIGIYLIGFFIKKESSENANNKVINYVDDINYTNKLLVCNNNGKYSKVKEESKCKNLIVIKTKTDNNNILNVDNIIVHEELDEYNEEEDIDVPEIEYLLYLDDNIIYTYDLIHKKSINTSIKVADYKILYNIYSDNNELLGIMLLNKDTNKNELYVYNNSKLITLSFNYNQIYDAEYYKNYLCIFLANPDDEDTSNDSSLLLVDINTSNKIEKDNIELTDSCGSSISCFFVIIGDYVLYNNNHLYDLYYKDLDGLNTNIKDYYMENDRLNVIKKEESNNIVYIYDGYKLDKKINSYYVLSILNDYVILYEKKSIKLMKYKDFYKEKDKFIDTSISINSSSDYVDSLIDKENNNHLIIDIIDTSIDLDKYINYCESNITKYNDGDEEFECNDLRIDADVDGTRRFGYEYTYDLKSNKIVNKRMNDYYTLE